jgi:hypothetical protein
MRKLALAVGALAALAFTLPGQATAATPVQWCGDNTAATDRLPDSTAGRQVHAIYAFPSDGADRTLEVASVIASDLAEVDTWWRREDPARTPRFDIFAFPNCTSRMGSLDISSVRLPQPASFYGAEDNRYQRIRDALVAAPSTFASPYKKYLVYYDGALTEPVQSCGQSTANFNAGGAAAYAIVYYQTPPGCRDRLQSEFRFALTAGHELIHVLGALPIPGPPHACPGDAGHPCDSSLDILSPDASSDLNDLKLDVGRDDYYAHPGSWPDIQDSLWLSRLDAAPVRLTVTATGGGTVTADLPGFTACTATCAVDFDQGTVVFLTATTPAGATFRGWSGACTATGACSVTLDTAKTVTATFVTPTRLTVAVTGPGSVASSPAGIACPGTCATDFDGGSRVTLTAQPQEHGRFTGWAGACSGLGATCVVALDQAASVQATFELIRRTLTVRVTGSGTVTSAPSGIRCRPRCSASYVDGRIVRLVARAVRGWKLSRWSGACRGSRGCGVTLNGNARVNAVFVRVKK